MTTKKAIWLVIIAELIIYLFLFAVLIVMPFILEWAYPNEVCTDARDLLILWPIGFLPAILGLGGISVILRRRKEAKSV